MGEGIDIFGTSGIDIFSSIRSITETFKDDIALQMGTGGTTKLLYETADANANELILVFPEGGATDVPVLVIGDASIDNVDLGAFNGQTEPRLVVYNDAANAYIAFDAGDDAVAQSKGIYFKAAADEDIELINLSVTGTPRIFWDESESSFSANVGLISTSLATSAAIPLLFTYGQLVNISLTSQTVGATTLTIPDFASVVDEFVFKTKAITMSNKTFVAPALGAATATSINGLVITTTAGTLTIANDAAAALVTSGAYSITLTATAATNVTLPTTGTLATLAGTEELDSKTLDSSVGKGTWTASGTWTIPAVTLGGTITGGANILSNLGMVYIGDTANAKMTLGLTINQGAADDEAVALKSSDVSVPMTTQVETDTYGNMSKASALGGGLAIAGASDSAANGGDAYRALYFSGYLGQAANTSKGTGATGRGIISLDAYVTDGSTSVVAPGADANMLSIESAGTVRFIFDQEGQLHSDVTTTLTDHAGHIAEYDEYEDWQVARALKASILPPEHEYRKRWSYLVDKFQPILANSKVITYNEDGHHFLNHSKMMMFTLDGLYQVGRRAEELADRLADVEKRSNLLEQRALALTGGR